MNISIKVSIAVFSYNQEKYIRQTLDSIIAQEHPYSWELIVCDDASQDTTPEIISEYAGKHPEIVPVLRRENLGLIKNFFDGISRCKGEYIMVCGGDDYYLPNKIKDQIAFLELNQNIGFIHSDIQTITEQGKNLKIKMGSEHSSVVELLKNYTIYAPTMAFRAIKMNQYTREINPIHHNWVMEDLPITIWFTQKNLTKYFPGTYVAYRIVKKSISHPTSKKKLLDFAKSILSVYQFFQEKYPESISKQLIYHQYLKYLLKRQELLTSYQNYCYQILEKYNYYNSGLSRNFFKIRIKYPLINRAYNVINILHNQCKTYWFKFFIV